ncbi:MAG TPA: FHA domain-containing protein [Anaerolineales bacterium]|nr:FHA domain-containing protein [Anaerolineales bacterium]
MNATILLILRLLIVAALYAFAGWAFYALWRDFRCQVKQVSEPQAPPLRLIPTAPELTEAEFWSPEVVIGRDPACEYPIDDPTISARHARLSYHHGQWWVEDLLSTNGTFLNQERVHEPLVIASGDQLRCGQFTLTIEEGHKAD